MQEQKTYINVDGIRTHYHEDGEGEPVLLIHGSGPGVSAWANWRLVFPILSKYYRLYAPDVVGFGYTQRRADNRYSVDVLVNHLLAFIEKKELRNLSIVGNSMGGALALHIAHRRPDLVNKLVLMGSMGVSFPISSGLNDVWGYTPSLDNMRRLIGLFGADDSFADNKELVRMRYEVSIQEGFQESFSAMFPEPRQDGVESLALSQDALQKIHHSTLLIHGREDRVIPLAETSWKLLQLLPNVQLHVFSNCGHWTQIEKTEPFCQQVISFLQT